MSFSGLRVLSLESRRAREIETLILRQGGVPIVAPSVKERALDDHAIAFEFLEELEAGEFDLVVCMTGVGLTFLRDVIAERLPPERLTDALRRVTIVSRGPKPVAVLRSLGVPVHVTVPEPNTWKEVVEAVAVRPERRIAVQEYGRPNPEFVCALEGLDARVKPVALYRWTLPDDIDPLRGAIRSLAERGCDVVLFTSSVQLDHLLQVAAEMGLKDKVCAALREHAIVASVGPIMTEALLAHDIKPHVAPEHPKMGALVKAAAEFSACAYRKSRTV